MFTGLIEEVGTVEGISPGSLKIKASKILDDIKLGDSMATNGVCLTLSKIFGACFSMDVMPETLRRSNLGSLKRGDRVNLERAMPANGRFGGHIVSGHIDGTGIIRSIEEEGNAVWVTVAAQQDILRYVVEKGSVCMDGISLTVAFVDTHVFKVSVIPHTAAETTLLGRKTGEVVNLECDIIGKYIAKLMGDEKAESRIDAAFLEKCGF